VVDWIGRYRCGCESEEVNRKRKVPKVCPEHGEERTGAYKRGTGWNSSLKAGSGPTARPWREVHEDDPGKYGPIFEVVKRRECIGRRFIAGHRCAFGHTAHHWKSVGSGGADRDGLLPCCGLLHRGLDGDVDYTAKDVARSLGMTINELEQLALEYVAEAEGRFCNGDGESSDPLAF